MSDWWLVALALAAVMAPVVGWLAVRVGAERRACAEANAALAELLDEVVPARAAGSGITARAAGSGVPAALRRAEDPPGRR